MINLSKKTLIILLVLSLLLAFFYSFNSFQIYNNNENYLFRNISMIFVCLTSCTVFLVNYMRKNNIRENKTNEKFIKLIHTFLLFFTVFCYSNFQILLIQQGLKTGKKLFWQISTIFLAVYILIILINLITKNRKINDSALN